MFHYHPNCIGDKVRSKNGFEWSEVPEVSYIKKSLVDKDKV